MYKPPHQQKNAFISKKKPQMASLEDTTAFPELITQVKKKEVQMDFTPLRIENAQSALSCAESSSLITAPQ